MHVMCFVASTLVDCSAHDVVTEESSEAAPPSEQFLVIHVSYLHILKQ